MTSLLATTSSSSLAGGAAVRSARAPIADPHKDIMDDSPKRTESCTWGKVALFMAGVALIGGGTIAVLIVATGLRDKLGALSDALSKQPAITTAAGVGAAIVGTGVSVGAVCWCWKARHQKKKID